MAELNELINRLKASDREAFNEIYGMFHSLLINYATQMVSREVAEDIVQDVFLKLWTSRANILSEGIGVGGGNLRGWLLRITYNSTISTIRHNLAGVNHRHWMHGELEAMYEYYDPDRNDIMRKLYSRDIAVFIEKAISALPAKCREVFRLSYIESLSNKEIADRLGISVSTVENHIHNALVRLRNAINSGIL